MIRLALPNKGRISKDILKLMEKIGLGLPENGRKLYGNTTNPNIQIVYARAADIPLYVERGAADIGITGEDMIAESQSEVVNLLRLNFGNCKVVVAVPDRSKIKIPADYYNGMLVATKLPAISESYFSKRRVKAKIVKIAGATEIAPYLGIAELIVDQVSTGSTLAANNLRVVDIIMESSISLISNPKSLKEKEAEIDSLKIAMESVITAETKCYIMLNVTSKESLDRVVKVMPCMESPTVLQLAKKEEYSVHSVVDKGALIETIRKLKKAGGKDILVMNMSRVVE